MCCSGVNVEYEIHIFAPPPFLIYIFPQLTLTIMRGCAPQVKNFQHFFAILYILIQMGKNMHTFYQLEKTYAFFPLFTSPFFPNLLFCHILQTNRNIHPWSCYLFISLLISVISPPPPSQSSSFCLFSLATLLFFLLTDRWFYLFILVFAVPWGVRVRVPEPLPGRHQPVHVHPHDRWGLQERLILINQLLCID